MNNVLAMPKKSSKLTRRERRNQELELRKLRKRTYTFAEMEEIVAMSVKNMEHDYDKLYTAGMAVVLNSEPTKFGKKRVCRAMGLFFEQLHAIKTGVVDEEQVIQAAKELGVIITHTDEGVEVLIKDHNKKKTEEKEVMFDHDPNGPRIECGFIEREEGLYAIRKNKE